MVVGGLHHQMIAQLSSRSIFSTDSSLSPYQRSRRAGTPRPILSTVDQGPSERVL